MENMVLSVIIPCYNEASRLSLKEKIIRVYNELSFIVKQFELILVDDGSTDNTYEVLNNISSAYNIKLLRNEENRGKGYSIRRGMVEASGNYILYMDADLSTPIYNVRGMSELLKKYDCVIASRYIEGSEICIRRSIIRIFISKLCRVLIHIIFKLGVNDSQCGFKLLKKDENFKIDTLKCDRWLFDIELLLYLKRNGYKIKEYPVSWTNNKESTLIPIDAIKSSYKEFFIILKEFRRNKK